jgi:hypothetical protein
MDREPCTLDTPWATVRMDVASMSETQLTGDHDSLETTIRSALAEGNHERIAKIVHQLCHDYAYAVHQPHARNGGLIGLAAAAIALGAVSPSGNLTTNEATC